MAYDFFKAPDNDTEFNIYVLADPVNADTYAMLKINTSTRTSRGVVTKMSPDYIDGLEMGSAKDKQRVFKIFGGRDKFHQKMQTLIEQARS